MDEAAGATRPKGRRRWWWVAAGLVLVAGVTIAIVVVTRGSTPDNSPTWTIGSVLDYLTEPDAIYVEFAEPTGVGALDPATGAVRWRTAVHGSNGSLIDLAGGVLGSIAVDQAGAATTTFLDPTTGRLLAQVAGEPTGTVPGTSLVLMEVRNQQSGCNAGCELAAVDPVTGNRAWKIDVPAGTGYGWFLGGAPGVVLTLTGSTLTTVNARTGAVVFELPLPTDIHNPRSVWPVSSDVAVLLVAPAETGGSGQAEAVELGTGARLWSTPLTPPYSPSGSRVQTCGDLLCVHQAGRVDGLAPDSGRQRFAVAADDINEVGSVWVAAELSGVSILDPSSFATIAHLPDTYPIGALTGRPGFVAVRPSPDHAGHSEVVAVDPGGTATVLFRTDGQQLQCGAEGSTVICGVGAADALDLRAWRIAN